MDKFGAYLVGAILFAGLAFILIYDPFSLLDGDAAVYDSAQIIAVGERNAWNAERTTSPAVIYDDDEKIYKMWYVGMGIFDRSGIGYATSSNGVDWTPQSDPVLTTADGWEANGFRSVHVLKDGNSYRMWYTAEMRGTQQRRIGYASSPDGVRWAKSANNPVVNIDDSGAWDGHAVEQPFVLNVDNQWHMWFTGVNAAGLSQIGYAVSPDGIRWNKAAANPVFFGQKDWDHAGVGGAFVSTQYNGQLYEMWFHGTEDTDKPYGLGHAYSNDGITWAEDESTPNVFADGSSFLDPWVASVGGTTYIWSEAQTDVGLPRQTITITTWPRIIVDEQQVLPEFVPTFSDPSQY
jgi:predicted GH43/DUF377 family glycosyl hydrolase